MIAHLLVPTDAAAAKSRQFPSVNDPDPAHEAKMDRKIERQERKVNRAPRSDKGTKRGLNVKPLSIQMVSAMSTDQAQELIRLVAARSETLKKWEYAQQQAQKCEADFKQDAQALQKFIEALAVTK